MTTKTVFRSTCKECVAAGMDPELATIEGDDAAEHAEAFNHHMQKKHSGEKPAHKPASKKARAARKKK